MLKLSKNTLLYFLAFAILPYCYLSFFSYPIAEDFGFATRFQETNFLELLKSSYLKMNGRYIANIFMYASPVAFNSFFSYQLFPMALILLLFLANFLFIKSVNITKKNKSSIIYALLLTLIYLHNLPIISEGLYWHTASSIYTLGIIFAQTFLAITIYSINNPKQKAVKIFSVFLLFLACGFNEVLSLLLVTLLFVSTFIFFKNHLPQKKYLLVLLLFASAFTSIMVLAPGNTYRGGMYVLSHNIESTVIFPILQTGRFFVLWALSIPLVFASILFYKRISQIKNGGHWIQNNLFINKWLSLSMLLMVIWLCVFPPYWFTGILGQHRTLNISYFFFLLVWFLNIVVWFDFIKRIAMKLKVKWSQKQLVILLLLGIFFTGNGYKALIDIFTGDAQKFKGEMLIRFDELEKAQKTQQNELILSPIKTKPKTLFVTDISKDPAFWTNQGYNDYFRLKSTKIYLNTDNE